MLHFGETVYTCITEPNLCTACSPKSADETLWTLPIERPSVHANSVLSLPSDRKFVQFTYVSFGSSPAISTYKRAIRKGYLSTIPRLTSAFFSKHTPNSVASAMGHLDRRRQGLDSTKKVRPARGSVPGRRCRT